jgi:tetratricopeptide (TPR) repeat protein
MKNLLLYIVPVACALLFSCSDEKRALVSPSDYEETFQFSNSNATLLQVRESITFWEQRCLSNSQDFVAVSKLASLYATSFKLSGQISELTLSDSLYQFLINQAGNHSASVYRSLATNSISRHEFWRAKKYINQALAIGEGKASSLYILTDIHLELGNVDSAKVILNNFTNKKTFSWLIRQAKVLDHQGDLDSAIVVMEDAHRIVRSNPELFCWSKSNLADMYGHAGRIHDAYQTYLEVLEKKPDYDYAMKGIAWIAFSHDNNPAEAEKIIRKLMQRKHLPDYYLMMADIKRHTGNIAEAKYYEGLVASQVSAPVYGNMYNRHLIGLYADLNPSLALQLAEREITVRPTAESYDLLAWTMLRNGQGKQALNLAQEFVEGRSHEPEVFLHLAEIYSAYDKRKADSYLKKAAESKFEIGPLRAIEIESMMERL